MLNRDMEQFIGDHEMEALELLKKLAQIPAPSNHEEQRAKFCMEWLKKQGAEGVYIDEALNVVYPIDAEGDKPLEVYMAHMDVVFPDEDALPLAIRDGRIYCPGVGDDTACLVCILMAAKYIAGIVGTENWKNIRKPDAPGLLLVCNSAEEGLGNLKGVKQICETYGDRMQSFCTFDSTLDKIVDRAVGSKRYRISVSTEGGHSFNDFGKENAIEKIAGIISKLYSVSVPEGGKTTFNVGEISGGTSVNVIAQNAEMLYEFRSDVSEHLDMMEEYFQKIISEEQKKGLNVLVEVIGLRPCGKNVDPMRQEELCRRALRAVEGITGKVPKRNSGSTDCNIPLSLGIPSVCIGSYMGAKSHTREEYVEIDSLKMGYQVAFEMIFG